MPATADVRGADSAHVGPAEWRVLERVFCASLRGLPEPTRRDVRGRCTTDLSRPGSAGDASPVTVAWLWLYGPPGVGKSATGFELFEQLTERGDRVAFVELDQIGMCMPAPVAARSAAKADNLLGMLDNFAAAGADGVIVSGDVVDTMRDLITRARGRPLLCRLRAHHDVIIERLTIRDALQYAMTSSAYESYDVPDGDLDISTHPLDVAGVAAEIARRLGPWPPASTTAEVATWPTPPVIDDSSAILVTGPRAVGTSTVAWRVLMASVASGRRHRLPRPRPRPTQLPSHDPQGRVAPNEARERRHMLGRLQGPRRRTPRALRPRRRPRTERRAQPDAIPPRRSTHRRVRHAARAR